MGSKFFRTHIQQGAKRKLLDYQKRLIEKHFDFLKCRIEKNVLICVGYITSQDYINKYKVEIRYVAGHEPCSTILEPADITPCREIHMYDNHSLCLHFTEDMKWTGHTLIYKHTIPWVVEWTHFYELYLVNGGYWEGPESPVHFTENDKNRNEDFEEAH
jgi:hypothetical protein